MTSAGILQAVVKNERVRAGFDRASRASDPIRPDPAGRDFGQQQRLVADHRRGMGVRVDEQRLDAFGAAIAARQEGDAPAVGDQHPRQRQRRRRLARAAGDEIADADRRRAGALAWPPHAPRGRPSVGPAGRLKQARKQGRLRFPPEARRPHRSGPGGRQQGFQRAHRAVDRARATLDRIAGRARHRAQPRRIGEQRDQRLAQILRPRDGERAAGLVERRVSVGEIFDHRPMQNGGGEPGGFDRILPAAGDERLAHEHDAGQAIEEPQFADRVADIDRRLRDRIASPRERKAQTRP